MEEVAAAAAAGGGIGDDIKYGYGKKPKLKRHVDPIEKLDQLFIGQKSDMSQMVDLMKTILTSTPAAAAAAAITTPTVTPPTAFADYSAKIMILLEEKKRYKDMGECVMSLDVKIQKLSAKRDELDEL